MFIIKPVTFVPTAHFIVPQCTKKFICSMPAFKTHHRAGKAHFGISSFFECPQSFTHGSILEAVGPRPPSKSWQTQGENSLQWATCLFFKIVVA